MIAISSFVLGCCSENSLYNSHRLSRTAVEISCVLFEKSTHKAIWALLVKTDWSDLNDRKIPINKTKNKALLSFNVGAEIIKGEITKN